MPRLPEPGKDSGQWGDILNQYLRVVHDVDGSIKPGIISSVGLSGLYADLINKPTIPSTPAQVGAEPEGLSTETQAMLNSSYVTVNEAGELVKDGTVISVGVAKSGQPWWDKTFAPPPVADLPTVTISTTTPTIGTLVAPKRVADLAAGTLDMEGDTSFRYDGGPGGENVNSEWVQPVSDTAVQYLLHPETITSPEVADVYFKVRSTTTELALRVVVNGAWVTVPLQRFTVTASTTYWVRLAFPSAASRMIRLELLGHQFGGAMVVTGGTLTRPPRQIARRIVVLADSFGGGALESSRLETFANYLAKLLEADSFWNLSAGGTGWMATPSNTFTNRLGRLITAQPHIAIIVGSRNDEKVDITKPSIYAAVRDGVGSLDRVPIVLVAGPSQSVFSAVNQAVKDGTRMAGRQFIDVLSVINSPLVGSDGVHPNPAGHKALSAALYAGIDRMQLDATVAGIPTTLVAVSLAANPNPVVSGSPVTLTATVTPAAAGRIKFRDGTSELGTITVSSGTAVLNLTSLPNGMRSLTAEFIPTSLFVKRSSSETQLVLVAPAALTDIILTNLLTEYDARKLTGLTDGVKVPSFIPTRGARLEGAAQGTTSAQPSYVAAASHGHPALKFTAAQGLIGNAWATSTTVGTNLTFYTVHAMTVKGTGVKYVFRGVSPGDQIAYYHSSGVSGYTVYTKGAVSIAPSQPETTAWQVTCVQVGPSGAKIWQNTLVDYATANVSTSANVLSGLGFGSGGGGTTGYEQFVSEILAYTGTHTDDERIAMMTFLADQFNITLNSPS